MFGLCRVRFPWLFRGEALTNEFWLSSRATAQLLAALRFSTQFTKQPQLKSSSKRRSARWLAPSNSRHLLAGVLQFLNQRASICDYALSSLLILGVDKNFPIHRDLVNQFRGHDGCQKKCRCAWSAILKATALLTVRNPMVVLTYKFHLRIIADC